MEVSIIEERYKEHFYREVKEHIAQGFKIKWESFLVYMHGNNLYTILAVKGEKGKFRGD